MVKILLKSIIVRKIVIMAIVLLGISSVPSISEEETDYFRMEYFTNVNHWWIGKSRASTTDNLYCGISANATSSIYYRRGLRTNINRSEDPNLTIFVLGNGKLDYIQLYAGLLIKSKSIITLNIGRNSFPMEIDENDRVFANIYEVSSELTNALKSGRRAEIEFTNNKGTEVTDIFPLGGVKPAIKRASKHCQ